ncbi:hypothetical protein H4R34_002271 [Dimargaris verticillata]|uniref:Uncharacterized protein n=1 Tax=Dimargaris verticillata TaxID=2761393 RepID=A0A9W8EDQ0_9FUNG|nr:hypothetical protein H4R34_002271 [Dimargaris verticillata]
MARRLRRLGEVSTPLEVVSENPAEYFGETPHDQPEDILTTSPTYSTAAQQFYGLNVNWSTNDLPGVTQGPGRQGKDGTTIPSESSDDDDDSHELDYHSSSVTVSSDRTLVKPNTKTNARAKAEANGNVNARAKPTDQLTHVPSNPPLRKIPLGERKAYNSVIDEFLGHTAAAHTPSYNPFTKSSTLSDITTQLQSMGKIPAGTILRDPSKSKPIIHFQYFLHYILYRLNIETLSAELANSVVISKFLTRLARLGKIAKWRLVGLSSASISEWTSRVDNALTQQSNYIIRFLDFLHQERPEWSTDTKGKALVQFIKHQVTHNAFVMTDALTARTRLLVSLHAAEELDTAYIRNMFSWAFDCIAQDATVGNGLIERSLEWNDIPKDLVNQPPRRWQQLLTKVKGQFKRNK